MTRWGQWYKINRLQELDLSLSGGYIYSRRRRLRLPSKICQERSFRM